MNNLINQCKLILKKHYESNFAGLVVYGSTARKENTSESDVDLLVLLNNSFDFFKELKTIIDLLYPVQLMYDKHISAKPVDKKEYESGSIQLYRNAKREGVLVV